MTEAWELLIVWQFENVNGKENLGAETQETREINFAWNEACSTQKVINPWTKDGEFERSELNSTATH